ncbi:MAG: nitrogen regulation protein NR(I), partial [Pseudomonadota bacterium]|nr:nitrogen regulation protein NR(I) [Pseudomonadota bacterium]
FERSGYQVQVFERADELTRALDSKVPDTIISDIRMPGTDGLALLKQIKQRDPDLPIVIMTAHSDLDTAVSAFKGGAFEYLAKPFDIEEARNVVAKAMAHRSKPEVRVSAQQANNDIIGESAPMQDVFRAIGRLSASSVSVLITGETGTGKERVARALHKHSPRSDKPFIALNMAAIPADLVESELFGHERGAFTGADKKRDGRFLQADGGTLFLDEIGDMPLSVQTRLLRVLAEGQFYPVGAHQPVQVNVRVIAATHRDLNEAVANNEFREDLYHRLNVIQLRLPALRERKQDIPLLARHFLKQSAIELEVSEKQLSDAALAQLEAYGWPGNVRQLENVCRWLTVMAPAQQVSPDELPHELLEQSEQLENGQSTGNWRELLAHELRAQTHNYDNMTPIIQDVERIALRIALEKC